VPNIAKLTPIAEIYFQYPTVAFDPADVGTLTGTVDVGEEDSTAVAGAVVAAAGLPLIVGVLTTTVGIETLGTVVSIGTVRPPENPGTPETVTAVGMTGEAGMTLLVTVAATAGVVTGIPAGGGDKLQSERNWPTC
jgi:hypothetical protein